MVKQNSCYYLFSPLLDQSYAIAGFLHKYKPDVEIVGVEFNKKDINRHHSFLNRILLVEELAVFLEAEKTTLRLIPTGAISTKYCLEYFGKVNLGDITLTKEALQVYNKVLFLSQAEDAGVPVPRTWTTPEDIVSYPVFVKAAYEGGGSFRGIAQNRKQLPPSPGLGRYLFQEVITGHGTYGVAFLADRGNMLTAHTHLEASSFPKAGGSAILIERFSTDSLIDYTARLIEKFNYSGWGLAEFKFCPARNDFVVMEINGKFWASCEFTFMNDPKFLKMLFDINSREHPVKRMFFVNRAFARNFYHGMVHTILHIGQSSFRQYPRLLRQICIGLIPGHFRIFLRRIAGKFTPAS